MCRVACCRGGKLGSRASGGCQAHWQHSTNAPPSPAALSPAALQRRTSMCCAAMCTAANISTQRRPRSASRRSSRSMLSRLLPSASCGAASNEPGAAQARPQGGAAAAARRWQTAAGGIKRSNSRRLRGWSGRRRAQRPLAWPAPPGARTCAVRSGSSPCCLSDWKAGMASAAARSSTLQVGQGAARQHGTLQQPQRRRLGGLGQQPEPHLLRRGGWHVAACTQLGNGCGASPSHT